MKFNKETVFWTVIGVVFLGALWLLWSVALPFIVALVITYLLNPIANWLQTKRFSRLMATVLIMSGIVLIMAFLLLLGIPALVHQLSALAARLPSDIERLQAFISEFVPYLLNRFNSHDLVPQIQKNMGEFTAQAATWIGTFLSSLVSGGQALVSFASLVVITPVVVFYLLVDWRSLMKTINAYIPVQHAETVWQLGREISAALDGFFRGQFLVCLLLGLIYATGLWLIGLNSGVMIGLVAGLISFIPYVGSLTGLVLAVGVAIAQFWPEWPMVAATLGVFLGGQFIEGNILSPKLVGNAIGVHPVWLMFALFAFGSVFGFGGLLIAAPMAAVIGVLVRFASTKYLESSLYLGEKPKASRSKKND
ncbi:AI-2E family transporter [Microvirga sp. W0021]|uniref:AI-2E family transporter n=1 Tax=Hohaiivirga grylli TaxID=3133970 RepID=A0ABV0BJH3_9HYPH